MNIKRDKTKIRLILLMFNALKREGIQGLSSTGLVKWNF